MTRYRGTRVTVISNDNPSMSALQCRHGAGDSPARWTSPGTILHSISSSFNIAFWRPSEQRIRHSTQNLSFSFLVPVPFSLSQNLFPSSEHRFFKQWGSLQLRLSPRYSQVPCCLRCHLFPVTLLHLFL